MVAAGRVLGREKDALDDATSGRKGWDLDWQRGMRVLTLPSSFCHGNQNLDVLCQNQHWAFRSTSSRRSS